MEYKGYTIEILGRTENGRAFLVDVRATQGSEVKERQFDGIVSIAGLKSAVMNWIDTEELKTTLPDSGVIDFTPPPTPEPEPVDEEREAWTKDWQQLQKVQRLSEHGVEILTSTQKTALASRVRTNFKPEYQDLV